MWHVPIVSFPHLFARFFPLLALFDLYFFSLTFTFSVFDGISDTPASRIKHAEEGTFDLFLNSLFHARRDLGSQHTFILCPNQFINYTVIMTSGNSIPKWYAMLRDQKKREARCWKRWETNRSLIECCYSLLRDHHRGVLSSIWRSISAEWRHRLSLCEIQLAAVSWAGLSVFRDNLLLWL